MRLKIFLPYWGNAGKCHTANSLLPGESTIHDVTERLAIRPERTAANGLLADVGDRWVELPTVDGENTYYREANERPGSESRATNRQRNVLLICCFHEPEARR